MTKAPIAVLGIDLGKNTCSVAGLDASGAVVLRRRVSREGVVRLAAGLPACVVAMEACCGAHHCCRRSSLQRPDKDDHRLEADRPDVAFGPG